MELQNGVYHEAETGNPVNLLQNGSVAPAQLKAFWFISWVRKGRTSSRPWHRLAPPHIYCTLITYVTSCSVMFKENETTYLRFNTLYLLSFIFKVAWTPLCV